jgi:4'-phosphopantetheinyl transferase
VKVYLCDTAKWTDGDAARLFCALPAGRRAYAERYKDPTDRISSAVGFLLVARALREKDPGYTPADWAIGEHGKPYLPGSDLHFSLSHADGLSAAVLSDRPIGLDVERIRPLRRALLPRFCTPEEIGLCERDPDLAVQFWTKREARAKENGRGIGQKLTVLPTDGVTSLRIDLGERSFWLSYTANEPAEPAWIKPEELI